MGKRYLRLAAVFLMVAFASVACKKSSGTTSSIGAPREITSWEQLTTGDRVGVQSGTTGAYWAQQNLKPNGVAIVGYTKAPDIFNAVESGQLTAAVVDLPVALDTVKSKPTLKVVQQIATGEQYGFAVNKGNPLLQVAINKALGDQLADGEYATIFEKYFPDQQLPPYASPTMTPACRRLKVLFRVSSAGPSYCAQRRQSHPSVTSSRGRRRKLPFPSAPPSARETPCRRAWRLGSTRRKACSG